MTAVTAGAVRVLEEPRDPSWGPDLCDLFRRYRDEGRDFVTPRVDDHEQRAAFDRTAFERLGAMGLYALGDGRLPELFAALEGLATGADDAGFCVSIVAHASVVIPVLAEMGSSDARARFLPGLVAGTALGAVANAEPASGTDVLGARSRVRKNGDGGFRLSARKRSITNVGEAEVLLVSAREREGDAKRNLAAFVSAGHAPGCFQRKGPARMGLRTSPTGDFLARNVMLAPSSRLGDGVVFFRRCFALERLTVGALYVGALRRSVRRALACMDRRPALAAHQYVQERVVRMRTSLACMESLLFRTRALFLANAPCDAELSILKGEGAERALEAAGDVVRLMGARGFQTTSGAEKDVRDLIGLTMLGGTAELHKNTVFAATQRGV